MASEGLESLERRSGSFDTLRLIGALLVLVGHSYVLVERTSPALGGVKIEALGLAVFFALSGYLVTGSFLSDPRLATYLLKRVLRIFPALLVVLLVLTFLLGPLVSTWNFSAYITNRYTYLFLFRNALLWHDDWLPGVFEAGPFRGSADGSLWTLPIEFALYLVAPLGVGLARWSKAGAASLLMALALAAAIFGYLDVRMSRWSIYHVDVRYALQLVPYFLCGVALKLTKFEPSRPGRLAIGCATAFLAAGFLPQPWNYVVGFAPLTMGVLSAGRSNLLASPRLARVGDLSYGIYLVAWPIQGVIVQLLGHTGGPLVNAVLTFCIAVPCAWASWRYIEEPALRLKAQLIARRPSLRQPQVEPISSGG